MNHREIDLTKKQIKILKYYSKHPSAPIENHSSDDMDKLISLRLLYITNQAEFESDRYMKLFGHTEREIQPQLFSLTMNGEMFLYHHKKDMIRTYLPILISILALIISVISLIKAW